MMFRWVLLIVSLFAAPAWAATSYNLANGATQNITEFSNCRKVTNAHASGLGLFIPTNTSTEWTTFYGNPPVDVTIAACSGTVIALTSGTSWTVPSGVTSIVVEVIGGGAGGGTDNAAGGSGGGGGGAYSKNTLTVTPGASIAYGIGVGGTATRLGGVTWFGASTAAACTNVSNCLKAAGGFSPGDVADGAGRSGAGGGLVSNGIGATKYAGGGGAGGNVSGGGGGGGGAAGKNGNGNNGVAGTANGGSGGTGDAGFGGSAGGPLSSAGAGAEWTLTAGGTAGSGGGGGGGNTSGSGSLGGLYGGGGGGGGKGSGSANSGQPGVVIITY